MVTIVNPDIPGRFLDPADLGCPPDYGYSLPDVVTEIPTYTGTAGRGTEADFLKSSGGLQSLRSAIAGYTPSLAVNIGDRLSHLTSEWASCVDQAYNSDVIPLGRDPPRVITPMNFMAGATTVADPPPAATPNPVVAQAQSTPTSPIPAVTPGPNKPKSQDDTANQASPTAQNNVGPQDINGPQNDAVRQDSASSQDSAAPQDPSASSDPAKETQADPAKQASTQGDSNVAQGAAPHGQPVDSAAAESTSSQSDPLGKKPDVAAGGPAQSPATLANAPAFAQYGPKPIPANNQPAAAGQPPNAVSGEAGSPSPQNNAAPTGIGAMVNAAMNGKPPGPGGSLPSGLAGGPSNLGPQSGQQQSPPAGQSPGTGSQTPQVQNDNGGGLAAAGSGAQNSNGGQQESSGAGTQNGNNDGPPSSGSGAQNNNNGDPQASSGSEVQSSNGDNLADSQAIPSNSASPQSGSALASNNANSIYGSLMSAYGFQAGSTPGATGSSYSRSFPIEAPSNTIPGSGVSPSAVMGGPQPSNSNGQPSGSLPSLAVVSGSTVSSGSGGSSASSSTAPSGSVSSSTGSPSSPTGGNGKPSTTTTSQGGAPRTIVTRWLSLGMAVGVVAVSLIG